MTRICLNVTDEMAAGLKERARVTGVLQSEIIRRAIEWLPPLELVVKILEGNKKAQAIKQPVLIAKASE